jgi:hypothetical protein
MQRFGAGGRFVQNGNGVSYMKKIICAALLAGFTVAAVAPAANAAVGISFDFGNVGMAYNDGYYDNDHHWHHWRHGEWDRYRHDHPGHYNNWGHNDRHHHDDWHH